MSEQGRLIVNGRGESAKAIPHGGKVTIQATTGIDRVTTSEDGLLRTVELELPKREAVALALQILDAAGYAAEVKPAPSRTSMCHGDGAIDACDTRDICQRWGCRKQPMRAGRKPEMDANMQRKAAQAATLGLTMWTDSEGKSFYTYKPEE